MTRLQAVRWFADYVAQEHVILVRDTDWGFSMGDAKPRILIPQDLNQNEKGDKEFRIDFTQRCPMGCGFANVTLSILHEIGHHFNREIFIFFTDVDEYNNATGFNHFKLPCEVAATNWAIEWLHDPENRKVAKKFERDFFNY